MLSCNLCCWTPNYPNTLIPPSQHLTSHSTAAPIIEPNQDFSQLDLQLTFFCFSFVSVAQLGSLLTRPAGEVKSISSLEIRAQYLHFSASSRLPSGLWTCFCSVNQSGKKDQFVSGEYQEYQPTIWKIFHVKSRLLSPVALVRVPH